MDSPRIDIRPNGPYLLTGVPVVSRQRAVPGDGGHPAAWEDRGPVDRSGGADAAGTVALCRCGGSGDKPFCDGSHRTNGFDGTETAPTTAYAERAMVVGGGGHVVDDRQVCAHAGFCAAADTTVWKLAQGEAADDPATRERLAGMVDRCPSGALTRRTPETSELIEPELGVAARVVDDGPLVVTGGVPINRSDGKPFEARNRVALCRCGASARKPLCDGSHAKVGFADA